MNSISGLYQPTHHHHQHQHATTNLSTTSSSASPTDSNNSNNGSQLGGGLNSAGAYHTTASLGNLVGSLGSAVAGYQAAGDAISSVGGAGNQLQHYQQSQHLHQPSQTNLGSANHHQQVSQQQQPQHQAHHQRQSQQQTQPHHNQHNHHPQHHHQQQQQHHHHQFGGHHTIDSTTLSSALSQSKKSVDKGSDEYKKRRERNNVAVRKSREKAKLRSRETERRVSELSKENQLYRAQYEELRREFNVLKSLLLKTGLTEQVIEDEAQRHTMQQQISQVSNNAHNHMVVTSNSQPHYAGTTIEAVDQWTDGINAYVEDWAS